MLWTCDKCGSENVSQEWAFYASMNSEEGLNIDDYSTAFQNDFYWCEDCDEDCSPIDSEINSLHEDYVKE